MIILCKFEEGSVFLVVYQLKFGSFFCLWLFFDLKCVFYVQEMEYWFEQFYEFCSQIIGCCFDLSLCCWMCVVDCVIGIKGFFDIQDDWLFNEFVVCWFEFFNDFVVWVCCVIVMLEINFLKEFQVDFVVVVYLKCDGQCMMMQIILQLFVGVEFEFFIEGEGDFEYCVGVEVQIEMDGQLFDQFCVCFKVGVQMEKLIVLVFD